MLLSFTLHLTFGFPCYACFLREICWKKNHDKPVNSLHHKGFPICPYYAIRAHLRNSGPPERCGCQNGQQYAWALRRGLHPPHLYPRHSATAKSGGRDNRKFHGAGHVERKIRQKSQTGRWNFLSGALCPSPDISACGSRCGSGRLTHILTHTNSRKTATKTPEILKFREFSGAAGRI